MLDEVDRLSRVCEDLKGEAMAEWWVKHLDPRWIDVDDGCDFDIPCVVCGEQEEGVYTEADRDSEYEEDDNDDGHERCFCRAHLDPVCSWDCKQQLKLIRTPGLEVEEGL